VYRPATNNPKDQPSSRRGRSRTQILSIVVGLVVLGLCTWLVARNAADLRATVADLGITAVVVAGVLGSAGTVLIGWVWFVLLRGLGVTAPGTEAAPVFFVSQLGKYLPGSVWPVVAQMEFGQRWHTPRRTMLTANVLMIALLTATGLVTGAALLPWSSEDGLGQYWWTLLLLPALLVLLHPRTIPAVLDWLFQRLGREPLNIRASTGSMLVATALGFAVWLVMGLHVMTLVSALGPSGPVVAPAAIGGMGLAWAAGLIFVPAPAGAGIRDAVLVATFAPVIGITSAFAVALASRVLLLLADVVLALAGAIAFGHQRKPRQGYGRRSSDVHSG
jgi:glycosyltransferase 2 family protein